MEKIFEILLEQFGSLAWWYALAKVIISWLSVLMVLAFVILVIVCVGYIIQYLIS